MYQQEQSPLRSLFENLYVCRSFFFSSDGFLHQRIFCSSVESAHMQRSRPPNWLTAPSQNFSHESTQHISANPKISCQQKSGNTAVEVNYDLKAVLCLKFLVRSPSTGQRSGWDCVRVKSKACPEPLVRHLFLQVRLCSTLHLRVWSLNPSEQNLMLVNTPPAEV